MKPRPPITPEVAERIHAAQETAFQIALDAGREAFYRYAEAELKKAQDRAFKEQDGYELVRDVEGKPAGVKKLSDETVYFVGAVEEYTPTGQLKHAVPMPVCFCPQQNLVEKINNQLAAFGFEELRVFCKHHALVLLLAKKEDKENGND